MALEHRVREVRILVVFGVNAGSGRSATGESRPIEVAYLPVNLSCAGGSARRLFIHNQVFAPASSIVRLGPPSAGTFPRSLHSGLAAPPPAQ